MLKYCSIIKNKRQFVLLLVIFLFACNGNGNQQYDKKISDTIPVNRKVEPVKNNNKNLPVQITENATDNRLVGKTFIGKLRQSCVMTTNGGFDIYIFLILSFDKQIVTVKTDRLIGAEYDGSTVEFINKNVDHFNK